MAESKLREISRLVADEIGKRVVVVDTSNEIAGDGDTPHPAIGHARRMQVRQPEFQKDIMIEAVENHTPEVIVVDEIGTEAEAQAARTIAERGVMLIATAHGTSLESLIKNPTLSDLVGGIQSVTLGDDEARRRASQKTVLEREKQPTFDIVIEILDRNTLAVYKDTAEAVDYILRGWPIRPEIRKVDKLYDAKPQEEQIPQLQQEVHKHSALNEISEEIQKLEKKIPEPSDSLKFSFSREKYVKEVKKFKKIYLYAVSRTIVEKIIERFPSPTARYSLKISQSTSRARGSRDDAGSSRTSSSVSLARTDARYILILLPSDILIILFAFLTVESSSLKRLHSSSNLFLSKLSNPISIASAIFFAFHVIGRKFIDEQ